MICEFPHRLAYISFCAITLFPLSIRGVTIVRMSNTLQNNNEDYCYFCLTPVKFHSEWIANIVWA